MTAVYFANAMFLGFVLGAIVGGAVVYCFMPPPKP